MADDCELDDLDLNQQDVQRLQLCERQLMLQEKWIQNAIKSIKEQRLALEVENMSIQNILKSEQRELSKQAKIEDNQTTEKDSHDPKSNTDQVCSMAEMDSAKSSMNTKTLDLSIDTLIDDIILTQGNTKDSESEMEQED